MVGVAISTQNSLVKMYINRRGSDCWITAGELKSGATRIRMGGFSGIATGQYSDNNRAIIPYDAIRITNDI